MLSLVAASLSGVGGVGPVDVAEADHDPAPEEHCFADNVPNWVEGPYGDQASKLAVSWITDDPDDARCTLDANNSAQGFMTGYKEDVGDPTDDTFRGDLSITRGQSIRVLYRLAGSPDVSGLPDHGLSDVKPWFEDAATWALHDPDGADLLERVATGYPDGTFRPNVEVTRAQFVRWLFRMDSHRLLAPYGKVIAEAAYDTPVSAASQWSDLPGWVAKAAHWAYFMDIINGYNDHTFRPDVEITRFQVAFWLHNWHHGTIDESSAKPVIDDFTGTFTGPREITFTWDVTNTDGRTLANPIGYIVPDIGAVDLSTGTETIQVDRSGETAYTLIVENSYGWVNYATDPVTVTPLDATPELVGGHYRRVHVDEWLAAGTQSQQLVKLLEWSPPPGVNPADHPNDFISVRANGLLFPDENGADVQYGILSDQSIVPVDGTSAHEANISFPLALLTQHRNGRLGDLMRVVLRYCIGSTTDSFARLCGRPVHVVYRVSGRLITGPIRQYVDVPAGQTTATTTLNFALIPGAEESEQGAALQNLTTGDPEVQIPSTTNSHQVTVSLAADGGPRVHNFQLQDDTDVGLDPPYDPTNPLSAHRTTDRVQVIARPQGSEQWVERNTAELNVQHIDVSDRTSAGSLLDVTVAPSTGGPLDISAIGEFSQSMIRATAQGSTVTDTEHVVPLEFFVEPPDGHTTGTLIQVNETSSLLPVRPFAGFDGYEPPEPPDTEGTPLTCRDGSVPQTSLSILGERAIDTGQYVWATHGGRQFCFDGGRNVSRILRFDKNGTDLPNTRWDERVCAVHLPGRSQEAIGIAHDPVTDSLWITESHNELHNGEQRKDTAISWFYLSDLDDADGVSWTSPGLTDTVGVGC